MIFTVIALALQTIQNIHIHSVLTPFPREYFGPEGLGISLHIMSEHFVELIICYATTKIITTKM